MLCGDIVWLDAKTSPKAVKNVIRFFEAIESHPMPRSLVIPRSLVGVGLSLSAVLFGVLTGILVKKLSSDVTLVTTLFYRFLFSLPILFAVALYSRGRAWLQINQRKTMCLRVFFGFCGIIFWFLSLRNMPFGLATSLFQSSVIFITLIGHCRNVHKLECNYYFLSSVIIIF